MARASKSKKLADKVEPDHQTALPPTPKPTWVHGEPHLLLPMMEDQARSHVQHMVEELRRLTGHPLPGLPRSVADPLLPFGLTTREDLRALVGPTHAAEVKRLIKGLTRNRFYLTGVVTTPHRVNLLSGEMAEPRDDGVCGWSSVVRRALPEGIYFFAKVTKPKQPRKPAKVKKAVPVEVPAPPDAAGGFAPTAGPTTLRLSGASLSKAKAALKVTPTSLGKGGVP